MRYRILLKTPDGLLRKFWWIEYSNGELYWGASSVAFQQGSGSYSGKKITLDPTVLKKYDKPVHGKYSYHRSGNQHLKVNGKKGSKFIWPLKKDIKKPFRFCAIISRKPFDYSLYLKSPSKGNSIPIILDISKEYDNQRVYFEFHIIPEGTFPAPIPFVNINFPKESPTFQPLPDRLTLGIRHIYLPAEEPIQKWNPDCEVSFISSHADEEIPEE